MGVNCYGLINKGSFINLSICPHSSSVVTEQPIWLHHSWVNNSVKKQTNIQGSNWRLGQNIPSSKRISRVWTWDSSLKSLMHEGGRGHYLIQLCNRQKINPMSHRLRETGPGRALEPPSHHWRHLYHLWRHLCHCRKHLWHPAAPADPALTRREVASRKYITEPRRRSMMMSLGLWWTSRRFPNITWEGDSLIEFLWLDLLSI